MSRKNGKVKTIINPHQRFAMSFPDVVNAHQEKTLTTASESKKMGQK